MQMCGPFRSSRENEVLRCFGEMAPVVRKPNDVDIRKEAAFDFAGHDVVTDEPAAAQSAGRELWLIGDLSDLATKEFTAAGWEIHPRTRSQLLPGKD